MRPPSTGRPVAPSTIRSRWTCIPINLPPPYGEVIDAAGSLQLGIFGVASADGGCSPEPILTIGLNTALESGFSTLSLPCPPNGYVGPANIAGYPVCQKTTDDVTITVSGSVSGSITGGAVFDTGTADMQIAVPTLGSSFPADVPSGSQVSFTTPSGFTYGYTSTGSDPLDTVVNSGFSGSSIIGIGFFTAHSFFMDFSSSTTGWE
jgi:hypothetical protein